VTLSGPTLTRKHLLPFIHQYLSVFNDFYDEKGENRYSVISPDITGDLFSIPVMTFISGEWKCGVMKNPTEETALKVIYSKEMAYVMHTAFWALLGSHVMAQEVLRRTSIRQFTIPYYQLC
jgi:hypothetical protein